jgi:predicted protein tyrosine phosphatase
MLGIVKASNEVPSKRRARPPPTLKLPTVNAIEESRSTSSAHLMRVLPNLFISGYEVARDQNLLQSNGITHILNLAGEIKCPNMHPNNFQYFNLTMPDNSRIDILFFIYVAIEFIINSTQQGGKVLIHCVKGLSRAPTVACGYLIIREKMNEAHALALIRGLHPEADPNLGFLCQLQALCKKPSDEERMDGSRVYFYSHKHDMMCGSCSFRKAEGNSMLHVDINSYSLIMTQTCDAREQTRALECLRLLQKFEASLQTRILVVNSGLEAVTEEMQIFL